MTLKIPNQGMTQRLYCKNAFAELERLNEQNEENFSHFYQLLTAETAKIGKNDEAMDYYLNAIKLAKQHEFLRNECLANELFARFWLQKGLSPVAAIYMTEASEKWGAIDTFELGYSVGVVVDIADWVAQTEIFLQPGDGMVLYTDRLTEARNSDKQLYTIERLCVVVSRDWHLSVQEILNAVIADVRQHIGSQKVYDDITLLTHFKAKINHNNYKDDLS